MSSYKRNKKLLIKLLGSVSLPPEFNDKERKMQLKGFLPKNFNVHHIIPKCMNGKDDIENLSIIQVDYHEMLHDGLTHILKAQAKLTKEDMSFMECYAKKYGAYTLNDVKEIKPSLRIKHRKQLQKLGL